MTDINDIDDDLAAHIRRTLTAVAATAVKDADGEAGIVPDVAVPLPAARPPRQRRRAGLAVGAAAAVLAAALVTIHGLRPDTAAVEVDDPVAASPPGPADVGDLPVDEALVSGSVDGVSDWWLIPQVDVDGGSDCAPAAMTLVLVTWHRAQAEGLGTVEGLGYGDRDPSGIPFADGGCPDETAWLADPTRVAVLAGKAGTTPYVNPDEVDANLDRTMATFPAYIHGAVHPSVTQVTVRIDGADPVVVDTVPVPERPDGPRAFATTAPPGSHDAVLTLLDASGNTVTEKSYPLW